MSNIDPVIPKLLEIKRKDQERRLAEIMREIRMLEQKLVDLERETARLDERSDGFAHLSHQNGFMRFVQHKREALTRQIALCEEQAAEVEAELRKSVYSQSVIDEENRA